MTPLPLAVVIASALFVVVAWRWPEAARLALVVLFACAGLHDLRLGLTSPAEVLDVSNRGWIELPRDLLLGFFARHAAPFVASIAAGQLAIAVLVGSPRPASLFGVIGASAYVLLVASSGIGQSLFSASCMAIAATTLGWRCGPRSVVAELASRWRRRRRDRQARRTSESKV